MGTHQIWSTAVKIVKQVTDEVSWEVSHVTWDGKNPQGRPSASHHAPETVTQQDSASMQDTAQPQNKKIHMKMELTAKLEIRP